MKRWRWLGDTLAVTGNGEGGNTDGEGYGSGPLIYGGVGAGGEYGTASGGADGRGHPWLLTRTESETCVTRIKEAG